MADWLSDEWKDQLARIVPDRPPAPGLSGVADLVIVVSRGKEVRCRFAYDDGEPSWSPSEGAPDVSFIVPLAEAHAVLTGEIELAVGFMRGRVKTTGPPGLVLTWLRSTSSPEWAAWCREILAFTDFPSNLGVPSN